MFELQETIRLIQSLFRQIFRQIFRKIKRFRRGGSKLLIRVVRLITQLIQVARHRILKRQRQLSTAGFVLPTVTMVLLVMVLLSVAMMLRSFESSETARYVRLNEAAIASGAGPGLERGIAKLREAEGTSEKTLTEIELNEELEKEIYTLPGEIRLTVAYDIEGVDAGAIEIYNEETIKTVWKFPVDTDGNNRYDSFNVYGIFHRTPKINNDDLIFDRKRNPLEATAAPQPDFSSVKTGCPKPLAVSRATVGTADWYKTGATLKKSFFIYSAIIPLTEKEDLTGAGLDENKYEVKKGSSTFAALELQEDRERVPLSNNAAVYEDDLDITPGPGLKVNGRIFTNGNLLTGKRKGAIDYYLVSSPNSCFYQMENSKIVVGGNVGIGGSESTQDLSAVSVDLFDLAAKDSGGIRSENLDRNSKPVTNTPNEIAGDDRRYVDRISSLVTKWIENNPAPVGGNGYNESDPEEVKKKVTSDSESVQVKQRYQALETYFEARTRRVPFAEAAQNNEELSFEGSGDAPEPLRPPNEAIYPYDPSDGSSNNGLTLKVSGQKLKPAATQPELLLERGKEERLGDRLLIGNGLPAKWYDEDIDRFSTYIKTQNVRVSGDNFAEWDEAEEGEKTRSRRTRMQTIGDLDPVRDGFWEENAAAQPDFLFSGVGGIRVITGAGVYERKNSFLPPPPDLNINTDFDPGASFDFTGTPVNIPPDYDDPDTDNEERLRLVWEDSMPMSPLGLRNGSDYLVKGYDNSDGGDGWDGGEYGDLKLWNTTSATAEPNSIDPNTKKYAKGDLRMRSSVVYMYNKYHYDKNAPDDYQAPQACISAYYDPTNEITARNKSDLPWNTDPESNQGKSNNGIVYGPPTTTASNLTGIPDFNETTGLFDADEYISGSYNTLGKEVAYQANLVFPSGRFVNETLREALLAKDANEKLSLSQQAAIDTTICSIQILDGDIGAPTETLIPHGAIKEVTLIDARQLRGIEGPDGVEGTYDLPVEDRQPLEIRLTQLDLDAMRKQKIGTMSIKNAPSSSKDEFLLPNSGIIYATRDDALQDLSAAADLDPEERKRQSAVDFQLDPTRRPSGIMLINGSTLARQDETNVYEGREAERGLILASNLPVYVQADAEGFNLHQTPSGSTLEEFEEQINNFDWGRSDFYDRENIDRNFACRKGDPRFPDCAEGDLWRPATVVSDAVTLLSHNFRPGYRIEGDYDLRNNTNIREDIVGVIRDPEVTTSVGTQGYDLDSDGTIQAVASPTTIDESKFKLDLDGDGAVSGSSALVAEKDITAAAAYKLKRLKNGFYENNFVTSFKWFKNGDGYPDSDNAYTNSNTNRSRSIKLDGMFDGSGSTDYSSYFNNFVTPVQRRHSFSNYLMETCMKLPISECEPGDWFVGLDLSGTTPEVIRAVDGTADGQIELGAEINDTFDIYKDERTSIQTKGNNKRAHIAGTTKGHAYANYNSRDIKLNIEPEWDLDRVRSFPKRVAFLREDVDLDSNGTIESNEKHLLFLNGDKPVPLGVDEKGLIDQFPYDSTPLDATNKIDQGTTTRQTLWFRTTSDFATPYNTNKSTWTYNADNPLFLADELLTGGKVQTTFDNTAQPLLVPVLQFMTPTGTPAETLSYKGQAKDRDWLQEASGSIFNIVVGSGDTPARAAVSGVNDSSESGGGLHNFSRYLESWRGEDAQISGSFIQFRRSNYGTGPFYPVVSKDATYWENINRFGYNPKGDNNLGPYMIENGNGQIPQYIPPNRVYGFDPGLLYQLPDLFGATFTQPSTNLPQNYLREVSRDNNWVKALLCAAQSAAPEDGGYDSADGIYGDDLKYAIPESQRPKKKDGKNFECPVELE